MSLPGRYNFTLQRGADFSRVFRKTAAGVAVNLTGLKVRAQFRTEDGSYGTTTSTTLLLALADGAGIEITDAAAGEITLTLTNAQTLLLSPENEELVVVAYGIELYDDLGPTDVVTPFLQGKATINGEVVR